MTLLVIVLPDFMKAVNRCENFLLRLNKSKILVKVNSLSFFNLEIQKDFKWTKIKHMFLNWLFLCQTLKINVFYLVEWLNV